MRLLVMLLGCLHMTVNARNLKMALSYHSYSSLIKQDMMDFCGRYINLRDDGRHSAGILSLEIPLKDIASNFSCTTSLSAPANHRVLVAFKKMKIPFSGDSCSDYVTVLNGDLNSVDHLSNRICGYYDDKHSSSIVYYSRITSTTLSVKVSKRAHKDYNYGFGFTLTYTVFNRSQSSVCRSREQMLCDNKICIWKHLKCNGHNNCGDGSDEKECGNDFPDPYPTDTQRISFPTSIAVVLFMGILLVIIAALLVILCYKRCPLCCLICCTVLSANEPGCRRRTLTGMIPTVTSVSNRPGDNGYDNNGFVPDPPPSYEEVAAASGGTQHESEQTVEPPDYTTACRILLQAETSTAGVDFSRNGLPIWDEVLSAKI